MLWTNKGKFLLLDWVFGGEPLPDNFYVALVTADNVPTVDTNTLSELTEIADGNGYTEGGYELTPGTPDFDVIIEDDDNNLAYIQIKDILWTAAGGNIPASGNGARYVVLTDDSESSAAALGDRQIIAVWDMVTDRVATNGFPISLTNLELRTVDLGTDSITEGEDAAPVPSGPTYGGYTGYESPLEDDVEDNADLLLAWESGSYQITNFVYGGYPDDEGQIVYQAFEAEATYTLKITRAVLFRNGEGGDVPLMTAKLYLADEDDKPTGAALMVSPTFGGWAHLPGLWVGNWADINWKDGSPKDYELQVGTKYVIEISCAELSYYSGFTADWMGWCTNDPVVFSGESNQYWWTPYNWWTDSGYICLFRNFGE